MPNYTLQFGQFELFGPQLFIFLGLFVFVSVLVLLLIYNLSQRISQKVYKNITTFKQVVLQVKVPKYESLDKTTLQVINASYSRYPLPKQKTLMRYIFVYNLKG